MARPSPSDSCSSCGQRATRERDDREVAREQQPRLALREAVGERPVVVGEPQLREHERRSEQRARGDAARPRTSGTNGIEPDHELRREDLAERERRGDRRRCVRDEPLAVRRPRAHRAPRRHEREDAGDGRRDRRGVGARARRGSASRRRHDLEVVPTTGAAAISTGRRGSRVAAAVRSGRGSSRAGRAGERTTNGRNIAASTSTSPAAQTTATRGPSRAPDVRDDERREHQPARASPRRPRRVRAPECEPLATATRRVRARRATPARGRSATVTTDPRAAARSR